MNRSSHVQAGPISQNRQNRKFSACRVVGLYLNRFWRKPGALAGAVSRLRLRHSQHWRLLQDLTVQSIPMNLRLHLGSLVLPACWLRAVNLHRASLQGLRPVRTTAQAIQRDHRCGVSCPGRASWPALDDHMRRIDVKIGAVKHTTDCTKVASEPN